MSIYSISFSPTGGTGKVLDILGAKFKAEKKIDLTMDTEFAQSIMDELKNKPQKKDVTVPGNYPYREFGGLPLKPKAGKKCSKCGLCASKCPVGAIPKENPSVTESSKCISCMRCISRFRLLRAF